MIKRSLCFLCVVSLLAGLVIIPANAIDVDSSLSDAGTDFINYLNASSYYWQGDEYSKPLFSARNASTVVLNFDSVGIDYGADVMCFSIMAKKQPSLVEFNQTYSDNWIEAHFEGWTPGDNGYTIYNYRVDMTHNLQFFEFRIVFSSLYTGDIALVSCYGVTHYLDFIDKTDLYITDKYLRTEGVTLGKTESYIYPNAKAFPFNYRRDTTDDLMSVDFTLKIDSDRFDTTFVDSANLLLTTYCEKITATASLISYDSSAADITNIKTTISTEKNWGIINQYELGFGTAYNMSAFNIHVDLSGYDLKEYELVFFVSIDSVDLVSEGSLDTKLFEVDFLSCTYVPTIISSPWYKPITDFMDVILGAIMNVGISVESIVNDLGEWFSEFSIMWEDRWNMLMLKLEEYFGEDGELAEKGDAMQNQADQMQQANDAMNSVEKPTVDAGAMLDQYLNFNPAGLAILSVITGNPFATSMLVVIFTFALCGYIFFGKKR